MLTAFVAQKFMDLIVDPSLYLFTLVTQLVVALVGAWDACYGYLAYVFSELPTFVLEIVSFWDNLPGNLVNLYLFLEGHYHSLGLRKIISEYWQSNWACAPPQTFFFVTTFSQTRYCELVNKIYRVQPVYSDFDLCLLCLFVVALIIFTYFYSGISLRTRLQEVAMKCLRPFTHLPQQNPEHLRSHFTSLQFSRVKPSPGHTHAVSACDRTVASTFIDRLGPLVGLEPYFVQRSRTDERKNRLGSRVHFWSKDLNVQPEEFMPPEYSLLAMVDVDQYVDMPSFLCDNFRPLVLYTFQPSQVSRTSSEYSYTFNKYNRVEYRVTGGGLYEHSVWNYSHDNIMVYKSFFGIPYKAATYGIDRRITSLDHELVLLTPLSMWTGMFALFARVLLFGRSLVRLNLVHGAFLRLKVHSMEGFLVSTGKVGEYAQATVPVEVDDTCKTIAETSKYDFTLPQAVSLAGGDKTAGAVLMQWNRALVDGNLDATLPSSKPDVVCPVSDSIRLYHFDPPSYDPADKPIVVPFMSPLLGDCFVPANSLTNIQHGVQERIEKVKPGQLIMTPFLHQVMLEFVELLIPEPNQIDPVDVDFLYDQQSKPTQRRILETLLPGDYIKRVVAAFVKKETYGELKAMRLISQICGNDKAAYSLFIYAFTEKVLKHQPWYAFGKTPQQIALRIAEVCGLAVEDVSNSDFSKFDGHGSNLMRELEALVLNRAFRHQYKEEVLKLHRTQYGLKAFVQTPDPMDLVTYDSEEARLSGSPETSSFNGVVNAFVSYLQFRLNRPDGTSLSPLAAWKKLGMYGGDDGLTADVHISNYIRAAQMIGQVLTVDKVKKHCIGVKFLARVYSPDVWSGDVNTCCDLPRQLTKLHVTVQLGHGVTPLMKLLEKCRAYWLTDKNTPILGDFVRKARFLLNGEFVANPQTAPMRAWCTSFSEESQYRNEPADWMMEYVHSVMPNCDFKRFMTWLEKVNSLHALLTPPLLQEPTEAKPKSTVVINGELVGDKPPVKPKPSVAPKVDFETFKAKKIAEGTWVERSKDPKRQAEKTDDKTKRPEKTGKTLWREGKGKEPVEGSPRRETAKPTAKGGKPSS